MVIIKKNLAGDGSAWKRCLLVRWWRLGWLARWWRGPAADYDRLERASRTRADITRADGIATPTMMVEVGATAAL